MAATYPSSSFDEHITDPVNYSEGSLLWPEAEAENEPEWPEDDEAEGNEDDEDA